MAPPTHDVVVSVRMTQDLARRLQEAARADDRSVSAFARRLILQALPTAAAPAAPTDPGPFCCPTPGENDRSYVRTPDNAI